jgi:hypothetical protein
MSDKEAFEIIRKMAWEGVKALDHATASNVLVQVHNRARQLAESAQANPVLPQWIHVDDKLPIDVGQVLMVFGEPLFGTCNPTIETGYYDKESEAWRFWTFDKEVNGFGVTHWMLLPEIPKQEKE